MSQLRVRRFDRGLDTFHRQCHMTARHGVRVRDEISQASSELSANERSAAGRRRRRNAMLRAVRTPILMMQLSKRIRSGTTTPGPPVVFLVMHEASARETRIRWRRRRCLQMSRVLPVIKADVTPHSDQSVPPSCWHCVPYGMRSRPRPCWGAVRLQVPRPQRNGCSCHRCCCCG